MTDLLLLCYLCAVPSMAPPQAVSPPTPTAIAPLDPAQLTAPIRAYVAAQVGDIISTRLFMERGGKEANPLMRGIVHSTWKLTAVKAALTTATIWLIKQQHRRAGIYTSIDTSTCRFPGRPSARTMRYIYLIVLRRSSKRQKGG